MLSNNNNNNNNNTTTTTTTTNNNNNNNNNDNDNNNTYRHAHTHTPQICGISGLGLSDRYDKASRVFPSMWRRCTHFLDHYIRNLHFYKDNSQYWLHNDCFLLYVYRTIIWDREIRHSIARKARTAAGII